MTKRYSSLLIIIGILSRSSLQNVKCMVDFCASCPNDTTPVCTGCESGWYLKSFTAHEGKPYNDCWWNWYWWLAFFAILLFLILCIVACFYLYKFGEQRWLEQGGLSRNRQMVVTNQRQRYATNNQQTVVYDPQPSTARQVVHQSPRRPQVVYSQDQTPTVIRGPTGHYSPRNLTPNYSPKASVVVRTPNRQF